MVALHYHAVKLRFRFRNYLDCIWSTIPITSLEAKNGGHEPYFLDAKIYAQYVFLESPERRRFVTSPHEYLIEQVQLMNDELVLANTSSRKIQLTFTQPVKEIVWVYTARQFYESGESNSFFRYDYPDATGADSGLSPVVSAKLLLNGDDRTANRPSAYYRLIQPYQHHARTPRKNVYVYSFALNPEDVQPSGSCNFSRVDSAHLTLTFAPGIPAGRLRIFGVSTNLLRIEGGMAGMAFTAG
jgi:hypothetical protein